MTVTVETITRIAKLETTNALPKSLLTIGTANPKVGKGEKRGYRTAVMHFAPANLSGFEVCGSRTTGCTAGCLNTAGRGGMDSFENTIHVARIRRTRLFKRDKARFGFMLNQEIQTLIRSAKRANLIPVIRLNGTSDLPWENVKFDWPDGTRSTVFDRWPDVQFYDYTKVIKRLRGPIPANYDLTFSLAESNMADALEALDLGFRVAVVFGNPDPTDRTRKWTLPSEFMSTEVIDADETDLRFLDDPGVICGLRAKGLAKTDTTGFVNYVS